MQKRDSKELNICTGWTQEWTCPKRLRTSRALDVREIVRGPFSAPKLLKTQPFVAPSSCPVTDAKTNLGNERNGIPDTWREYLASRGYCGATEARILKKNLVPCYVRCLATRSLWNELGLPFVQGIPDPWKSRSLPRWRSIKCSRKRCTRNKRTGTRIAFNYDGDDEEEAERNAQKHGQSNAEHTGRKKDVPKDAKADSNLLSVRRELYQKCEDTVKGIKRNRQHNVDQLPVAGGSMKSTSSTKGTSRRVKSNVNMKMAMEKVANNVEDIKQTKGLNIKKVIADPPNPVLLEKANQTVQTQNPPNIVCCSCKLHNYTRHFTDHVNKRQETNVSDRVLCQDCETVYHQSVPRRLDCAKKAADVCVPAPNKFLKHKIVAHEEIYKWTKLKLCACYQKAKQRFHDLNRQNCVETKNMTTSKTDLNLVCCRCGCPHLRIATNAADSRKCSCKTKRSSNMMQKESNMKYREPSERVSKNSATRKQRNNNARNSENGHCTCAENKRFVSKHDIERTPRSMAYELRNNTRNRNVHIQEKDPDNDIIAKNENFEINREEEGNMQNVTRTKIYENIDNSGTKKLAENLVEHYQSCVINNNVERRGRKKGSPRDDSHSDRTNRMRHSTRNKYKGKKIESDGTIITSDEKVKMKCSRRSKSDKNQKYATSDSSAYGDVSDNLANMNFSVTPQDRSSVTSITFIQHLKNSNVIRRLNQRKQPKKNGRRSLIPISKNFQSILDADNKAIFKRGDFIEPFELGYVVNEDRRNAFLTEVSGTFSCLDYDKSTRRTESFEDIIDANKNYNPRKARNMSKKLKHRMH